MLYQDNYFVVSVKLNFCQKQTHCIDNDQGKFHSEKAPINWHFPCQLISEAYKVQADCLRDSESDSYDQNFMKEKVNENYFLGT